MESSWGTSNTKNIYNKIIITERTEPQSGILKSKFGFSGLFDFSASNNPQQTKLEFEEHLKSAMDLVCLGEIEIEYFYQEKEII